MRIFSLVRHEDVSGVSGTGRVADGVEFNDGTVVLRWLTMGGSTGVYPSIEAVADIHGHNGATVIQWISAVFPPEEPVRA